MTVPVIGVLDRQIHEAESRVQLPGAGGVTGTQRDSVYKLLRFGFAGNCRPGIWVPHNVCGSQRENQTVLSLATEDQAAGLLAVAFTTT